MPDTPSHTAFYGDGEKTFALSPELVTELERKTGRGIGGLSRAMFRGDFHLAEITETIRLALIGGGTPPDDAAAIVTTYTAATPIMQSYALAVEILNTRMMGTEKKRGRR